LKEINYVVVGAVEARREVDLRMGVGFSRLLMEEVAEGLGKQGEVVSYGGWQGATLGVVVGRWREIKEFKNQKYWMLKVILETVSERKYEFLWKKEQEFDEEIWRTLYESVMESLKMGKLKRSINYEVKKIERPIPMNTVSFMKLACKRLKLSSAHAMDIAEKLYPRSETTRYIESINLKRSIKELWKSPDYGEYAYLVKEREIWQGPRNGNRDDGAHPPIHPTA
jgi:DNA topoisomerase III